MSPLKTTWHHIRRSPIQSFIAVLLMTICFFGLSMFVVISNGLSSVLNYFETKPEITIFIKDGLDKNTVENIQKELTNYPNIREIRFISKEKALTIYKEQNKNNPMLTEMVTASILPASFEVSVSDPKILEQIAQNFSSKNDQVDEIIYQKDIINNILQWTDISRKVGVLIISSIIIVTFILIVVLIGMKITNRKDEINISRSLGASKFYVKKPFLFEGLIYGITGSLLGTLISYLSISFYATKINSFFNPITFISTDIKFYIYIISVQLILGSFIGFLASYIGVKRYIKF